MIPFFSSSCTKLTSVRSLDSALELIILKSSSCSSEECLAASKLLKLMFTANLFVVFFFLAFLVAEEREKIKLVTTALALFPIRRSVARSVAQVSFPSCQSVARSKNDEARWVLGRKTRESTQHTGGRFQARRTISMAGRQGCFLAIVFL